MLLDFTSLLLATVFSGVCLSLTMVAFWLSARHERFLVTWAVGLIVVAGHVLAYWAYVQDPDPITGMMVVATLPVAAAVMFAAALQFVHGTGPVRPSLLVSLPYLAVALPLMGAGYDGIALIMENVVTAALLIATGLVYWHAREEARFTMSALGAIYAMVGVSFGLCGAVILVEGQWRIGHPPDNWAEHVNIVVSVAGMTVMGALSLSMNQARQAGRLRVAALTDPLSGLFNRRALIELHGKGPFGRHKAVVMFDLDHFKQTNDRHGHAVGDEVIRRFASALAKHSRPRDDVFRLGGEEFALVMPRVEPAGARKIATRIADALRDDAVPTADGPLVSTVSAGIAFGDGAAGLDEVMARADLALYDAKRAGRDQVAAAGIRLAG